MAPVRELQTARLGEINQQPKPLYALRGCVGTRPLVTPPPNYANWTVAVMPRGFLLVAAAAAVQGLVVLQPTPMRCHSLTAQACSEPRTCAQVRTPARRGPNDCLHL